MTAQRKGRNAQSAIVYKTTTVVDDRGNEQTQVDMSNGERPGSPAYGWWSMKTRSMHDHPVMRHLRKHYSDFAIRHDMDCIVGAPERDLPAVVEPALVPVVRAYARARRGAPRFAPGKPGANNHRHIPDDVLARIERQYAAIVAKHEDDKMRTCEHCHSTFAARRSDARYCSSKCRQRSRRLVTDNPKNGGTWTITSGASKRKIAPPLTCDDATLSVTSGALDPLPV